MNGKQSFVFSRNVAGDQQVDYNTLLDWSKAGGSRFVRLQLDSLGMGFTSTGGVDANWVVQWDQIFEKAEQNGIYILPVFSVWYDWNTGPGYSTWKSNPLNVVNGGPAQTPAELFQNGSTTQKAWLSWMKDLVKHWQGRKNILAWEIFSEVNLASGKTEANGMELVNNAASIIRANDSFHRPVTASIADTARGLIFIGTHPLTLSICIHVRHQRNWIGQLSRRFVILLIYMKSHS
ncbi:MAG TPA: hypothetical protein VLX61_11175 [Anaerolineales bacterium]|nr:hypothetical protein [Anaerolineales bacterium]